MRTLAARSLEAIGWRLAVASERLRTRPTLKGDRTIEWAWMLARLRREPGRVLDFGAGSGFLALAAALAGHEVVAVDLEPCTFGFVGAPITYLQRDVNEVELETQSFDQVLNCSTIEHVGVAGRYGSSMDVDGDIRAMRTLAGLLRAGGEMVLTLPIGRDDVFPGRHRIYGPERLPRLLDAYVVRERSCWAKPDGDTWQPVTYESALEVRGSSYYYALGLFVLAPK